MAILLFFLCSRMATKEEAEALLAEIIELSKTVPPPMSPPIRLRVKQEVSYKEMEEEEFGGDDDESSEDEKNTEKRPATPKRLTKRRVYYREKRSKMRMFCHVCNHPIRRHHKASHMRSMKHHNGVALLVRHGITPQTPTTI